MAACNRTILRKIFIPLLKQTYKSTPSKLDAKFTFQHVKAFHTSKQDWAKVAFNLSDIGEGIKDVIVKEWFVKVGDKVSQFDNICEVQSDKASVTITSRYDGTISKLYYNIEDTALVGKPLVDIETEKEVITEESKINGQAENLEYVSSTDSDSEYDLRLACVPSVRRLATQHKIDLNEVKGTGKDGRILKEDLLKYIENNAIATKPSNKESSATQDHMELLTGFKKAMVKTMTESLKIPHFIYSDEVIVTKLNKMRQEIAADPDAVLRIKKITLMPFFIKAFSNSLQRYPIINSVVDEKCERVTYLSSHNIGIAMDTANGLAVPIIRNVEKIGILEIAVELNRLLTSGKSGTFALKELTGGTFTVSNIGSIGGTYTKPVILPPQVAIVALGKTKTLPYFDSKMNVVPEQIVSISAAGDHRVIDGATMAKFINFFKRQIENPHFLFLNL